MALFRQSLVTAMLLAIPASAFAQDAPPSLMDQLTPAPAVQLPEIKNSYAPSAPNARLTRRALTPLTLSAELVEDGDEITRGLTWRVFGTTASGDGKLPLIASSQGGSATFELPPGSYLVHAAFGRAGATKKISVGKDAVKDVVVLDAGGLKLGANQASGRAIVSDQLRFAIYEAAPDSAGDRPLITRDVKPNTVVRLKAGQYYIVSNYGTVNAVVRSDVKVEAGKLTESAVEHNAAEITLKLVREKGGEALADTAWSILTESGDPITEKVGPYAQMVLADGQYTVIARNREKNFQRTLIVEGGKNEEVEVIADETTEIGPGE